MKQNLRSLKSNIFLYTIIILVFSSCTKDDKNIDIINTDFIRIPDLVFETILIEQGIDSDGEINQQILKTDAENVTSLDLENLTHSPIKDLTGIEGFINLKKLIATQHDIETISLSSNKLLDTLYLGGNYISEIDLSNNTNLILVDIQANLLNSILGLSNATQLKDLDLSWNYLEEFSSDNTFLEVLHLRNNDLKSINITEAINLKNILLTSNQLTSIDLRTNLQLETLLIPDNKIQSINLENNTNLKHLHLFENSLLNLDVSYNQNLIDLKVDRNPELTCIRTLENQYISTVSKSDYQELNSNCN